MLSGYCKKKEEKGKLMDEDKQLPWEPDTAGVGTAFCSALVKRPAQQGLCPGAIARQRNSGDGSYIIANICVE